MSSNSLVIKFDMYICIHSALHKDIEVCYLYISLDIFFVMKYIYIFLEACIVH
jgi:hypothetical protein